MKLIKFTSILLCIIFLMSVISSCTAPDVSKTDVSENSTGEVPEVSESNTSSNDSFVQGSDEFSDTVSDDGNKATENENDTSEFTEESKADVNSKDTTSQIVEDISEEVSEEVSKDNLEQLTFIIEDRTEYGEVVDDMPEEIYRDAEWIYKLPNLRSGNIFVVYSDGTEQGIKEALAEGKVSITDLDTFDILYFKYPIEE